jgi:hypothetical protein
MIASSHSLVEFRPFSNSITATLLGAEWRRAGSTRYHTGPLNLSSALTHDEIRSGLVQAQLTIEGQIVPIGVQKIRLGHMFALGATLLQDRLRLSDIFSRSEHVWIVD